MLTEIEKTNEYANIKIATLSSVREHNEGDPVELWLVDNGRMVVRCFNECGNNHTDLDLFELLGWVKSNGIKDGTKKAITAGTFVG